MFYPAGNSDFRGALGPSRRCKLGWMRRSHTTDATVPVVRDEYYPRQAMAGLPLLRLNSVSIITWGYRLFR